MTIFTRRTKAEKHKAAGDLYEAQGGDPATRDAVDRTAAELAQAKQRAELGRAELARGQG